MVIAFLSPKPTNNLGSLRIPFEVFKHQMASLGVSCVDELNSEVDAAVVCPGFGLTEYVRQSFPSVLVILTKPHYEINLPNCSWLSTQSLRNIVNIFRPNCLNKGFRLHQRELLEADLVIADSRRLKRYFLDTGIDSEFLRLIDYSYYERRTDMRTLPNPGESLNFVYHGNASLINLMIEKIYDLLLPYSETYDITLFIITEKKRYFAKRNFGNIRIEVHDFSLVTLDRIMRISHIGLAPDTFCNRKGIMNRWLSLILFHGYQTNLDISAAKFSANAGRHYVFSDYLLPFVCSSTEEVLLDFPNYLSKFGGAIDFKETSHMLEYLLSDEGYQSAQYALLSDRKNVDLTNECQKLLTKIEEKKLC